MLLGYRLVQQGHSKVEGLLPFSETFQEGRIEVCFQQMIAGGGNETEIPVLEGPAVFVVVPEGKVFGEEVVDAADSY